MRATEKEIELVDEFIRLSREKGYSQDAIKLMVMLSCCDAMEDNYGDAETALTKMIDICKKSETEDACVAKVYALTSAK